MSATTYEQFKDRLEYIMDAATMDSLVIFISDRTDRDKCRANVKTLIAYLEKKYNCFQETLEPLLSWLKHAKANPKVIACCEIHLANVGTMMKGNKCSEKQASLDARERNLNKREQELQTTIRAIVGWEQYLDDRQKLLEQKQKHVDTKEHVFNTRFNQLETKERMLDNKQTNLELMARANETWVIQYKELLETRARALEAREAVVRIRGQQLLSTDPNSNEMVRNAFVSDILSCPLSHENYVHFKLSLVMLLAPDDLSRICTVLGMDPREKDLIVSQGDPQRFVVYLEKSCLLTENAVGNINLFEILEKAGDDIYQRVSMAYLTLGGVL